MTKNSFNKEMLELQIGEVVGAMNASASPVQAMFYLEEDQKRLALMNPQHLCKLSLVLMSNVAWVESQYKKKVATPRAHGRD